MSDFYNARRKRNPYTLNSPFRLSRSGIDRFLNCPRCFYFDRVLGLNGPPGFPLTLNNAVDALMKKEFDTYRVAAEVPPVVKDFGLDLVPFAHPDLEAWQDAQRRGITHAVPNTNLVVCGGIDDVWQDPSTGEIFIVDYKATST